MTSSRHHTGALPDLGATASSLVDEKLAQGGEAAGHAGGQAATDLLHGAEAAAQHHAAVRQSAPEDLVKGAEVVDEVAAALENRKYWKAPNVASADFDPWQWFYQDGSPQSAAVQANVETLARILAGELDRGMLVAQSPEEVQIFATLIDDRSLPAINQIIPTLRNPNIGSDTYNTFAGAIHLRLAAPGQAQAAQSPEAARQTQLSSIAMSIDRFVALLESQPPPNQSQEAGFVLSIRNLIDQALLLAQSDAEVMLFTDTIAEASHSAIQQIVPTLQHPSIDAHTYELFARRTGGHAATPSKPAPSTPSGGWGTVHYDGPQALHLPSRQTSPLGGSRPGGSGTGPTGGGRTTEQKGPPRPPRPRPSNPTDIYSSILGRAAQWVSKNPVPAAVGGLGLVGLVYWLMNRKAKV